MSRTSSEVRTHGSVCESRANILLTMTHQSQITDVLGYPERTSFTVHWCFDRGVASEALSTVAVFPPRFHSISNKQCYAHLAQSISTMLFTRYATCPRRPNLRGYFTSAAGVFDVRCATRMLCNVANAANELPCMWESGKTDKSKHLSFTAPTAQYRKK